MCIYIRMCMCMCMHIHMYILMQVVEQQPRHEEAQRQGRRLAAAEQAALHTMAIACCTLDR